MEDLISPFSGYENKFFTVLEYVEFGDAKGCLSLREGFPFSVFYNHSSCEGASHSYEDVDFFTGFCKLFVIVLLKCQNDKAICQAGTTGALVRYLA